MKHDHTPAETRESKEKNRKLYFESTWLRFALVILLFSGFTNAWSQVCCPEFTLKDALEICPPEGACQSGTAPGGTHAMLVACKLSTHHYTVFPNAPGYTYTWSVTGGTSASPTGNPMNITWGSGSTGTIKVVISNVGSGGNCVDSIKMDICLVDGPQANFNIQNDTVCQGTPVIFTNTSTGGSDYIWDFGDGTFSTLPNPPPHVYPGPGTYTVVLTASNAAGGNQGSDIKRPCGCTDTISKTVVVLPGAGPTIDLDCCYGTVCPGDTSSFCTSVVCTTYNWSVTGGTIVSGAGTNCIKVKWNTVYSGPTTVTLAVPGCGSAPCPGSTTLNVPVLYPNLPISGPPVLCVGAGGTYTLPTLPGTYYQWTTTAAPGTYAFNDKNRNVPTVNITFNVPGTYQLMCQYSNPLAGCNGSSMITINVLPVFSFTGDDLVCEGSTTNYFANGNATWAVAPLGATITPGPAMSASATWTTPGTYVITATNTTPGAWCNATATKVVEVVAIPVLGTITGPAVACPGKNLVYGITSNTPDNPFVWTVTGGTLMTQMGEDKDSVIVQFTGTGPWSLSVYQQIEIAPGVFCQSLTQTLIINPYPAPVVSGPATVCVDAVTTFTATGTIPPGGITWSVVPPNRGSILSGQGTGSVNIRWHGTPTSATVTASHCGGAGSVTVTIVNPPSVGNITANGPFEYCLPSMPNNLTLSITSGFPSYQWYLNNSPISGATNASYLIPNATFTGPGIYYFSVDVSNGFCTITKTTYILIGNCPVGGGGPPNPVVCTVDFLINPNPACEDQPVTFTAVPTGPGFQFSWTFGDGATSFQSPTQHTYTSPGVYTVTLTATLGSCVATKTYNVTVNPSPVCTISAADTIFCPGGSETLTACGGMVSYQWYRNGAILFGATSMTYNAVTHGEYEVEVTNSFGCSAMSNALFMYLHPTPKARITGPGSMCAYASSTASFNLSAYFDPAYSYAWSSQPAGASFTPNNSNSAAYTTVSYPLPPVLPFSANFIVKVTDTLTGCASYDTLCITFNEIPTVSVPFYYGCEGTMVPLIPTFIDTTLYTYQWSNGKSTPSVTVYAAGMYSLTITDKITGCSSMTTAAIINPNPDLSLFPLGCDTIACKTDTLTMYIPLPLKALPPFNTIATAYPVITWYDNGNYGSPIATGPSFPFVASGAGSHQISVVVQNQYGCSDTAGVYCITVTCDTLDFGDAPDNPAMGFAYPTLLSNNGARHAVSPSIFLGSLIDIEGNGQPTLLSDGDDLNTSDDEDGVALPPVIVQGASIGFNVTASVPGFLDAWIDYNIDGDWADPGEHVFINAPLAAGPNVMFLTVPVSATPGQSYSRFRFRTSSAPITFSGLLPNGEVEDYAVYIEPGSFQLDWGDAPDSPSAGFNYPTFFANNGARHVISPNIFLGSLIDPEPDGQPNITASGDDLNNLDDEDGVTLPSVVMQGSTVNITVQATANGFLDAWIDYNIDGDWADPGEHVFNAQAVSAGANALSFTVPTSSSIGQSYSRFRYRTSSAPISYTGSVADGEVEDYPVYLDECIHGEGLDFGDVPDSPPVGFNYPTLLSSSGARHMVFGNIRLGALIDAETDGQPTLQALGDDLATSDDEDGITFIGKMYVGKPANIQVSASINGFLNAWMDFNKDGDWADAGEQIFANQPLFAGLNTLTFNIPSTALQGKTYTRFRFNTTGGLPYFGLATDGEVEDYQVHACPYWWPVSSPVKHLIVIPHDLPHLTDGDVLGVFYTDATGQQVCAGLTEFSSTDDRILFANGDNPNTPVKDGFAVGEPIIWKLCSYIKGDANVVDVLYDPMYPNQNGVFVSNGLSGLIDVIGLHVTASAEPGTICSGSPVQLQSVVSEPVSGVTYTWTSQPAGFTSNDQNPVDYPAVSTIYYVDAFDGVFHAYDTALVEVVEANPLQDNLFLSNLTVTDGQNKCYNAIQVITVAGSGSTFTVQNGGHAEMIAGQRITMLPGTKSLSGSYLNARITSNGAYCCASPVPAPGTKGGDAGLGLFPDFTGSVADCRIYPNPTTGKFTVDLKGVTSEEEVLVEVYTLLGERIMHRSLGGFRTQEFDISDRVPGVYLVRVVYGESTSLGKLIKQ